MALTDVTGQRTLGWYGRIVGSQEFWVSAAIVLMAGVLIWQTDVFDSAGNLYNAARNVSFIGIAALGQSLVIITGGIDLSVGSVMAIGAVVTGMLMVEGNISIWIALPAGLVAAGLVGLFNGVMVAKVKLQPFVVTLGSLSICRTLAMVGTNNKLYYEFGADEEALFWIGTGTIFGIPFAFILTILATLVFAYFLTFTRWGRHVYAIGGNETAARMTGVAVDRIKIFCYVVCSVTAGFGGILLMAWSGSLNNSIGTGYELRVIAASVIGGANLMGGYATAYGAFVGSILLEILRNSLVLLRIQSEWHLGFVGLFILLAVLLERLRDSSFSLSGLVNHVAGGMRRKDAAADLNVLAKRQGGS